MTSFSGLRRLHQGSACDTGTANYGAAHKTCVLIFALLASVALFGSSSARADLSIQLFDDVQLSLDTPQSIVPARHTAVVRQRSVEIRVEALQSFAAAASATLNSPSALSGTQYQLELFDGVTATLVNERIRRGYNDAVVWIGEVAGIPLSEVVLVLHGDIMQGNISWPGARYHLRYSGPGSANSLIHNIQDIDPSGYPPEHPPGGPAIPPVSARQLDTPASELDVAAEDDGSNIDIMILYTPASVSAVGGSAAMAALINLAVAEANEGYQASGVNLTMTLVHADSVDYTEEGASVLDFALDALTYTDDGEIDEIHALRDNFGADMVSMLVVDPDSCGLGWIFNGSSRYAFQVSAWDCAANGYTMAHEFGHNQGALHDWRLYDWPDDKVTGFSHGYVNVTDGWRTIMAYNDFDNCPRGFCRQLNLWSNPNRTYDGAPTGVAEGQDRPADNVSTLNDSAFAVANFRQSVDPGVPGPDPLLEYTPVVPCRLSDTRADGLGGAFGNGVIRTYSVLPGNRDLSLFGGEDSGCGVPSDAAVVHVNFTVIAPAYPGFLRAWPANQGEPTATVFAWDPGFGASNALSIPICSVVTSESVCSGQYKIKINSAGQVNLAVDLLGYYR